MSRMIPEVNGLVAIPVELRHPDREVELVREQLNSFFYPIPVQSIIS